MCGSGMNAIGRTRLHAVTVVDIPLLANERLFTTVNFQQCEGLKTAKQSLRQPLNGGSSIMLIALLWIAITLARDNRHMSSILAIPSLGLTRIRICM